MSNTTERYGWPIPAWDADWQKWQEDFADLVNNQDATVFSAMENARLLFSQLPTCQIVNSGSEWTLQIDSSAIFISRTFHSTITVPGENVTLLPNSIITVSLTPGSTGSQTSAWEVHQSGVTSDPNIVSLGYVDSSCNVFWWNGAKLTAGGDALVMFGFDGDTSYSANITEIDDGDSPYALADWIAGDRHRTILADTTAGPITINLPQTSAQNDGKMLHVKVLGGYDVTITANAADKIEGSATGGSYILSGGSMMPIALQIFYNGGSNPSWYALNVDSTSVVSTASVAAVGAEMVSNKNQISGYAGLDASKKLAGIQQTYGKATNTACEGDDERIMQVTDNAALRKYTITSAVVSSVWTVSIVEDNSEDLLFEVDGAILEHSSDTMSVIATSYAGTDATPKDVYVYVQDNAGSPQLVASNTNPEGVVAHAHVATLKAGTISTSSLTIYGAAGNEENIDEVLSKIRHRIARDGAKYVSGMAITSSSSDVLFATGAISLGLDEIDTTGEQVSVNGLFWIDNAAAYAAGTDWEFADEYSTGETINDDEYFNVVLGIVPANAVLTAFRVMAIVQRGDFNGSAYINFQEASNDTESMTQFMPSDALLRRIFVPVARVIVKKASGTDALEAWPNGTYHQDLRDAPSGGSVGNTAAVVKSEQIEKVFLPIGDAEDGASAPAAIATVTSGNGSVKARKFDSTLVEDVVIPWVVPDDIKAADGIKFEALGVITETTAPTSGQGVSFKMSGYSIGVGDSLGGTFGTEVESNDADLFASGCTAQYDCFRTTQSGTVTVTDLAAGELTMLHFERDTADADDDYAQDVGMYGVVIEYTKVLNS